MPRTTPLSTLVLLLGCIALGAVIALELGDDVAFAPEVTAAAPLAPEIPEVEVEPFTPPPPDAFAAIGERPLFVPSRRPFVPPPTVEPAAAPEEVAPAEPLTAELVGIMLTGSQRAALVQEEGRPAPRRLSIGQTVAGWRIEAVEHDRAVFRRGAEEQVLELRRD